MIWAEVKAHFGFPENTDLKAVRTWALQKGAIAFQTYKKRLTREYVKKGLTPDFKTLPKLRDNWDAFLQYKESEEGAKKIPQNTINASKKKEYQLTCAG